MTTVTIRHNVADFDTWKAGYDNHEASRRDHGCRQATVAQVAGSDTDLLVVLTFDDAASAQGFLGDPALKAAMADAGVQGAPDITIADEVESLDYAGASA